jgi:import inner membrane translocase subunit TIM10
MSATCFKKCVNAYNDSDLNVGEMTCTDRCISKYLQTQEKVGTVLQAFEAQARAQEAAGVNMMQGNRFGPGSR